MCLLRLGCLIVGWLSRIYQQGQIKVDVNPSLRIMSANPNGEFLFLLTCFSSVLILYLDVDIPVELNLDEYVRTPEFDHECEKAFRAMSSSGSSYDESLWSSDDTFSSTTEPNPFNVLNIESNLYYAGVGPKGRGPKLIYRTSDDVFDEPSGPEAYK